MSTSWRRIIDMLLKAAETRMKSWFNKNPKAQAVWKNSSEHFGDVIWQY